MENNKSQTRVKVAHIMLVHQLPRQTKRLIEALAHPQVHFFIHVDKKADETTFKEAFKDLKQVSFISNRVSVNWGGFSLIKSILVAMKEVSDIGGFTHINLLSGADYPLTTPEQFVNFLAKDPDKEYFEFYPVETEWTEAITRYTKYHFTDFNFPGKYALQNIINAIMPKRKLPDNMIAVGRLAWFTITMELCKYILDYLDNRKDVINFYKLTWGTDELIFQTIAYNSVFKDKMVNNSLRYVNFANGHAHPEVLDQTDFNLIFNKEGYFFARKFDPEMSADLLNNIDLKLKSLEEAPQN